MQQSHEEERGGGAGAGGAGAELDETPERSLTTEAVSEAKSFAPSSALVSAAAARCRWSCCVSAAKTGRGSGVKSQRARSVLPRPAFYGQ